MFSVQHTSNSQDQPAADHALFFPFIFKYCHAEGLTNFIHNYFSSQPSKSMINKRALVDNNNNNNNNNSNNNNNYNNNIINDNNNNINGRFHHSTVVLNETVYIIGGQSSFNNNDTTNNNLSLAKNFVVFNFPGINISEQDSNLSIVGHGTVPFNNDSEILIFFGEKNLKPEIELSNPGVQLVDVKTGNFSIPNNIKGQTPELRYHHSTTLINKKVYIIGGWNKDNVLLSDISYLDLSSNTWILPNIQQQRFPIAGHSTIAIDQYLISCFGFSNDNKLVNDCNVYDTSNNSYLSTQINGNLPSPRSYSSMILVSNNNNNNNDNDNTIITFGGLNEYNQGNNELYTLNTSKLPNSLSWAPIIINTELNNNNNNKDLIPSPRGGHSAFIISDKSNNDNSNSLMMIWGGSSNNSLVDSKIYFFNVKSSSWIDNDTAWNKNESLTDDNTNFIKSNIATVIGIFGGLFIIFVIIGFFLIHKKIRSKKLQDDKEIQNDPYIRPGGKLGSNTDLTHEESVYKSVQNSNIIDDNNDDFTKIDKSSHYQHLQQQQQEQQQQQQQEESTPPLSPSMTDDENDSEPTENRELSVVSINSKISDTTNTKNIANLPTLPIIPTPTTTKESLPQKIKKSSHKRSSSVSLSAYDLKQFVFPERPLFTANDNHNYHQHNHATKRSSLNHSSNSSNCFDDRSTPFQWVMKNNNDNNNNKREVKDKRSSTLRDNSQDEEYTIYGDYIDTVSMKISYNNFSNNNNNDNYSSDEVSNNIIKKSKRSSKRGSRVSFALIDEKIEYNESDSSKSVSLARVSARSSSSSNNSRDSSSNLSNPPSIIEEEEEEI